MRRLRRAFPLALAACLFASAAVAQPSPPPTPETFTPAIEEVPVAIVRLIADHGRSFQTHDADLLRGTVRAGAFARRTSASLANAANVPFAHFSLRPTTRYSGDLASARVRRRYPGQQVRAYHVLQDVMLRGIETRPFNDESVFTVVRERPIDGDPYEGWRIASTSDLEPLGFYSAYELWDAAPVVVRTSPRFMLLTHADVQSLADDVLRDAEAAYAEARKAWPAPTDERFAIIMPSTTEELRNVLRATIDLSKFVAFVGAGVIREGGWRFGAGRMFVHLSHFRRYGPNSRRSILTHELIHAVSRPAAGPFIPVWVEEGMAEALSGGDPSRAGDAIVTFPTDDLFVAGSVGEIVQNYARAQVAIQTLIDRVGRPGLLRFYRALGRPRDVPGTDDYWVRRAATAAGWSYDAWQDAWRKRLG